MIRIVPDSAGREFVDLLSRKFTRVLEVDVFFHHLSKAGSERRIFDEFSLQREEAI